jgi:hypothetical protein
MPAANHAFDMTRRLILHTDSRFQCRYNPRGMTAATPGAIAPGNHAHDPIVV